MANPSVALCAVAGGTVYEEYAAALMASAHQLFWPSMNRTFSIIPGEKGWPNGTLMRYHRLLENWPQTDYVFLCDADMLVESAVGPEILGDGISATVHPGYVGKPRLEFPYEDRPASAACVPPERGEHYFCGGFVGGVADRFILLAAAIVDAIDADTANGIVARWHDESHLNRLLAEESPSVILSPAYCHPENSGWYKTFWTEDYPRILTALDKPPAARGNR